MSESDDEATRPKQGGLPGISMGGPYLAIAVLCEKVLREADGVMSLIRIVDRITIGVSGPEAPISMPVTPINLTAVVTLKAGFLRGPYIVKIRTKSPSDEVLSTAELPVLFEGEDRGAGLVLQVGFQAREEGLYWFEVFVLDSLITKIPLRVVYQRIAVS